MLTELPSILSKSSSKPSSPSSEMKKGVDKCQNILYQTEESLHSIRNNTSAKETSALQAPHVTVVHILFKMKHIPGPSSPLLPRSPRRKTSKSCSAVDEAEVLLCKFATSFSAAGVGAALALSLAPSFGFSTNSTFKFSMYCFS